MDNEGGVQCLQRNLYPTLWLVADGLGGIFDDVADGAVQVCLVAIEGLVFRRIVILAESDVIGIIIQVDHIAHQLGQIEWLVMVVG